MGEYVCAVAGGKGGVGKTATVINLAVAMEQYEYETVVVDADLGMSDFGPMLGVDPDWSIHDVLVGDASLGDALTEIDGGIRVLAGEQSLSAYADADASELERVLTELREHADIVFVDTCAAVSHETTVPLGVADGTVVVTTPEDAATTAAKKTATLTRRVGGEVIGGVVTHASRDLDLYDVGDEIEEPVLGAIPEDPAAFETEPMMYWAVNSTAARAYSRLADRLSALFFDDVTGGDLEQAFHEEWFGSHDDETATEPAATAAGEEGDETPEKDGDEGDGEKRPAMYSYWSNDF